MYGVEGSTESFMKNVANSSTTASAHTRWKRHEIKWKKKKNTYKVLTILLSLCFWLCLQLWSNMKKQILWWFEAKFDFYHWLSLHMKIAVLEIETPLNWLWFLILGGTPGCDALATAAKFSQEKQYHFYWLRLDTSSGEKCFHLSVLLQ